MTPTPSEINKLKKELSECRKQLKEALAFNERLRSTIGYDELKGFKPQERLEKQYGWIYVWLYPLQSFISQNRERKLSDVSNSINNIVVAIIAQMAVHGKYGVSLPNDPRPVDISQFIEKQKNIFDKSYGPCAICGEQRITHECHILPRAEGGPYHRDNIIVLCPLHHHLFDHNRLSLAEWEALSKVLSGKMESAIIYTEKVRYPQLLIFWKDT